MIGLSPTLAKALCKGISKASGFKNNGVKVYNDYMSLNWTTTPSVLLEMGFLSNRSDDAKSWSGIPSARSWPRASTTAFARISGDKPIKIWFSYGNPRWDVL